MPTWGEILTEINQAAQLLQTQGIPVSPFDIVRRKYLGLVAAHSGRPTILYATAWLTNPSAQADDVWGFPQVYRTGSFNLRSKFDHIRIIVPHMAMSAATMVACSERP